MAVKTVGDRISEISIASKEQAQGISQVNESLMQMDTMTQGSSALVEETLAMSESLGESANHLIDLVSSFNIGSKDDDLKIVNMAAIEEPSLNADSQQQSKAALPKIKSRTGTDEEWEDF